jgi:hypothetical protein
MDVFDTFSETLNWSTDFLQSFLDNKVDYMGRASDMTVDGG